jgi:hypothetical protein
MKTFALLAVCAVCLVASTAMATVAYTPSVDVSLVPSSSTVVVGQEFTATVHLHDVQDIINDDDFHAQLLISYDPTKLQLVGADDPASITPFVLFGNTIPEYIWHAQPNPGVSSFTLTVGQDVDLPAMHFIALAPVDSTAIDISGPVVDENGGYHEGIKHDCVVDYTNSITGATVTVMPVPEPLTMVAAFMGLSSLGVYIRRRSSSPIQKT